MFISDFTFITNLLSSPNLYYNSHYEKILATGEVKCIDDEIPFEIPNTWEWVRFKNVADIARGGSPRPIKSYLTDSPNGVNWIKIGDTEKGGKYINSVKEKIRPEGVSSSRMVHKGDFLLTNSMSFGRPYITNVDGCIHDGWLVISPFANTFNQDYLFHLLSSAFAYNQFSGKVSGAVVKNLNTDKVLDAIIPLPPLNEQKRIAQRIEEIQPLIEKYRVAQEQSQEMENALQGQLKKSILQYAIQGKLVPQIESEESASILLEKIQQEKLRLVNEGKLKKKDLNNSVIFKGDDNKYFEKKGNEVVCIDDEIPFEIPDSWEWVRFKDLVQFSLGKTPERVDSSYWNPNDCPWVSIADMEDKTTLLKTKEYISQKALKEKFGNTYSPIGTLIMSFKLTIGKVSILGIDAVHNEAIISIFPLVSDDNITRDYLFNFLSIITGYTASTDAIKGATLNSKKISEMLVPLPPLQEQKRIVKSLDNVLASIMRN